MRLSKESSEQLKTKIDKLFDHGVSRKKTFLMFKMFAEQQGDNLFQ